MFDIQELEKRLKENLFALFAKDIYHARIPEIYTALANTLKQIIGEKWFHSLYDDLKAKRIYILSFEYTFGDNLLKNLIKLNIFDDTKNILAKYKIDIEDVLSEDLEFALGFGDLGAISGYLIEYLSSFHNNIYAYGLRYRKGMLKQEIINGEQIERPDDWKVNNNPWEHQKGFNHIVEFKNEKVKAIPYDIPIVSKDASNVNTLRLWKSYSTNELDFESFSKGNITKAYECIDRANSIVEFLYPSEDNIEGKKLRFTQEYFFASASIQDIFKKYKKYIGKDIEEIQNYIKIQINDVHPAISILIFIEILMKKYDFNIKKAIDIAKNVFMYVQFSLLPETYEKWEISIISSVAPNLLDIIYEIDRVSKEEFLSNKMSYMNNLLIVHDGQLDLINLLYYISKNILSIVESHKDLLLNKYLTKQYKNYKDKFRFFNFEFDIQQYFDERLKSNKKNRIDIKDLELTKAIGIKEYNKLNLIKNLENYDSNLINPKSAFIMHLGNFHEYKRQILSAMSVALNYMRLKKNPNLDIPERTYFFAGKSYPNYYVAKETIKFINALAYLINNDLYIKDKLKVVFIENYNLSKSNLALPASDIFLNLELINLESNNLKLIKAISTLSSSLMSNSVYDNSSLEKKGIDSYTFGIHRKEMIEDYSYNIFDYMKQYPEIDELFSFYRNKSKSEFPYDIERIYNSIYYFNDEYHILKDLFDFTDKLEEIIKKYSSEKTWFEDRLKNAKKYLSYQYDDIENYLNLMV